MAENVTLYYNDDNELEDVELNGACVDFEEVDDGEELPSPTTARPVVVVYGVEGEDKGYPIRVFTKDSEDVAFEEMDAPAPSRSVGGAKAPTASIPDSSVKASAAQVEKREKEQLEEAFRLLETEGGIEREQFVTIAQYFFEQAGQVMVDEEGHPVRNEFLGKQGSNGRIGPNQLTDLLKAVAPQPPAISTHLLWSLCRRLDRGATGFLPYSRMQELGSEDPNQSVDIVAFLRACVSRSSLEAVRKLGALLRCRTASLLQHVRAWAVQKRSVRPALISGNRTRSANLPSSAIYPQPDSSASPLAELSRDHHDLIAAVPGVSVALTLTEATGVPLPDSSFEVLARSAQVCLFNRGSQTHPQFRVTGSATSVGAAPVNSKKMDEWEFRHLPQGSITDENPVIMKLPPIAQSAQGYSRSHEAARAPTVLIELTATVRRRRPYDPLDVFEGERAKSSMARGVDDHENKLRGGSTLAALAKGAQLRERGKTFGSTARWVRYDWGKGLTIHEGYVSQSTEMTFVPLREMSEKPRGTNWGKHSFIVRTASSSWEFDCDSGGMVEKFVETIKADMEADRDVTNGEPGAVESYECCLGWVEYDVSKVTAAQTVTMPLLGGNAAAKVKIRGSDVPERNGFTGYYAPESTITFTVAPAVEFLEKVTGPSRAKAQALASWVPRLPALGCFAAGTVPLVVLFRQVMADKLWDDSSGLHWSFLEASEDPLVRYFPPILDHPDSSAALCTLWDRRSLYSRAAPTSREGIEAYTEALREVVLQLYPALAPAAEVRCDDISGCKERAQRLKAALREDMLAVGDTCSAYPLWSEGEPLVQPFHTEELISDTIDCLVPAQESVYASVDAAGHYGDQARAEITLLIERLIELLERGLAKNKGLLFEKTPFYSFFDVALSKSVIQNLMQWNRQSLEEVDAAFRSRELQHDPRSAYDVFMALQKADAVIDFMDPYHAMMVTRGGESVYFTSTVNAPSVWHVSEDFFFVMAEQ